MRDSERERARARASRRERERASERESERESENDAISLLIILGVRTADALQESAKRFVRARITFTVFLVHDSPLDGLENEITTFDTSCAELKATNGWEGVGWGKERGKGKTALLQCGSGARSPPHQVSALIQELTGLLRGSQPPPPSESRDQGNHLNDFQNFRTKNGSGQGQDLALTGLFVPSSLDSRIDFPPRDR